MSLTKMRRQRATTRQTITFSHQQSERASAVRLLASTQNECSGRSPKLEAQSPKPTAQHLIPVHQTGEKSCAKSSLHPQFELPSVGHSKGRYVPLVPMN